MRRTGVAALAALLPLLAMAGCANPEDGQGAAQPESAELIAGVEEDEEIAGLLPDDVRSRGIVAAINPDSVPIKFVDSDGEMAGLSPDLLRAAAKVLGTEVTFQRGTFDALQPGLEAKRYDLIASIGDFAERQDAADFIDYMRAGTAILATHDLDRDDVTIDELCGLSVGFSRGTAQQTTLEQMVRQCEENGEAPLEIRGYQDSGAGILAVKSGQDDAYWGDSPPVVYNAEREPDLYKVIYNRTDIIFGIGVHKDNTELRDAVQAAVLALVDSGVYEELLALWGQQENSLPEIPINAGISEVD